MGRKEYRGGFYMPVKKIVFYIMCGLLVTMLIVSGITIGKATVLVQGILNPAPPATEPPSTIVDTTGPADTTPPTSLPAVTEGQTDPNHEHNYSVYKTSAATCTEEGFTLYKCSCGDTKIDDIKHALGHSFGAGKVITSCTEENYTEYECSICKHKEKRDVTQALGHNFDQEETFPATCTEDAYTVRKCSNPNCNETETVTTPSSALGHDYDIKTVAATCFKDGYTQYTCKRQGCTSKPITVTIPATNVHDFTWEDETSTCKNPGCDIMLRKQQVGNTCVIEIHAGNGHKLYSYTIVDERSSDEQLLHPVTYELVENEGLVVTYDDANGQPQKTALGFDDNNLIISASDAPVETPTGTSTEPATDPQPSVPNGIG